MQNLNQLLKAHRRIQRALTRCCDRVLPRYGLSLEQYHMLVEIDELQHNLEDDPSMGCIAVQLTKPANTMSRMMQELEEQGFVMRYRDTFDRRIQRVCLTKQSRSCLEAVRTKLERTWARICGDDTAAEQYSKAADALEDGLQSIDAPDSDDVVGGKLNGFCETEEFPPSSSA